MVEEVTQKNLKGREAFFKDSQKKLERAPQALRGIFWLGFKPQPFLTRLIFLRHHSIKCLNNGNEIWASSVRWFKAMKCGVGDRDPELVPNFSCNTYFYYISGVFAQLFMHSFHFWAKNVCSGHGTTIENYVYGYQNYFKWTKNVIAARLVRLFIRPSLFCDFRCCALNDALNEAGVETPQITLLCLRCHDATFMFKPAKPALRWISPSILVRRSLQTSYEPREASACSPPSSI